MSIASDFVYVCILNKEAVCIPKRNDDVLENVAHAVIAVAQIVRFDNRAVHEEETYCVSAEFIYCFHRISIVAEALAHLASILCKHKTVYNTVFKCRAVEQIGGKNGKRIEPAARLIKAFADKVGREMFFKVFLVFKRIVVLRIRH